MPNHNSHSIGFYTDTLCSVYHDLVSAILPHTEIERDAATLRNRSLHEGTDFFTKVLPALGKSIDVSLANGTILNTSGFRKKAGTNLPRFMHDLFRTVFRDDGVPWFATWYSDYIVMRNRSDVVESAERADRVNDVGPLDESIFNRLTAVLEKNSWEAHGRAWKSSDAFPGLSILDKESFSSEEITLISLGLHEILPLLICENESNPCREAMVVALRALRQVCYLFYKLNIPYTDEQEAKTLADFVNTDSLLDFNIQQLDGTDEATCKQARQIICRVLANADPRTGIPRHGPGAVATGEKSPEKHLFKRIYRRLDAAFKYDEWFFCNLTHVSDSLEELLSLEELEAGTAKVVLVPKDSRGPRLISCEPLEYQWVQQSLMNVLVDAIEKNPWTKGYVNFTDQEVNRNLALKASKDYSMVTLDMKEASDRVSLSLVKALFPDTWWHFLYASRSSATQLPCGDVVQLKKFAPMGSAVCFPVEALIFWALSVASLMVKRNLPLGFAATKVYVYGDDIICDAKYHGIISDTLPKFGLLLNQAKCCVAGPFKESCGMDAFYGNPVTPTKIRSTWCVYPEPSMLASYVEYSNVFHRCGMFETAELLELAIQRSLKRAKMYPVPTVSDRNPSCIAFIRMEERAIPKNRALGCKIVFSRKGVNDYQKHEVRGYRIESKSVMTKTTGWPLLLRILAEKESKSRYSQTDCIGPCSLPTGHYSIAHRVKLKRAWTSLI